MTRDPMNAVRSKAGRFFISSVAALLGALAAALVLGNMAEARLVQPREPLMGMEVSSLYWMLASGAMAVALACIYIRQSGFKLALILWFAATVVIYRIGLTWQGIQGTCGYLGSLAHTFNVSTGVANVLLSVLFSYLLAGSAGLLLWSWLARPEAAGFRTACVHCGGHIAFSPANVGQKISCPHCRRETTLQKPGMLKMSCYFCKKHIEFPAYAIGVKIQCPHCKMDITLKEPAQAQVEVLAKAGE